MRLIREIGEELLDTQHFVSKFEVTYDINLELSCVTKSLAFSLITDGTLGIIITFLESLIELFYYFPALILPGLVSHHNYFIFSPNFPGLSSYFDFYFLWMHKLFHFWDYLLLQYNDSLNELYTFASDGEWVESLLLKNS